MCIRDSVLSVKQFNRPKLEHIFEVAHSMRSMVERFGTADMLHGHVLANLFYEPSTRTSSSFAAAMVRLGGRVLSINEVVYSSVSKGESLPDTVRTLECYADAIVLRHPEVGAAATAARYAHVPIINAGDGTHEHPTQALLDAYTLRHRLGDLTGRHVVIVGDLAHSRVFRSNVITLATLGAQVTVVAPPTLMPSGIGAWAARLCMLFSLAYVLAQLAEWPLTGGNLIEAFLRRKAGTSRGDMPPTSGRPGVSSGVLSAQTVRHLRGVLGGYRPFLWK